MLIAAKRALGIASLGIGIAAVAAPDRFARWLGLNRTTQSVSAFGAREIAVGSGLLSPVRPGPWLWLRVGEDLVDAISLRDAISRDNPRRRFAMAAMGVLSLIAVVDLIVATHAATHPVQEAQAAA